MLKERVQDYFNNHPGLRVLFFFDPEREYEEEVNQLELPDIHLEKYDNTPFFTKYKLLFELKSEKVFLYLPMVSPGNQEAYHNFPLLGLLLANKELRLDNVGEFMERYGLQRHQKRLVARYISELKYTGVQNVCEPVLKSSDINEKVLQRGLVSAFLKFRKIESWAVIATKLMVLASKKETSLLDRVVQKVSALDIADEIIDKLKENVGYNLQELSQAEFLKMAQCVLYNSITQGLHKNLNDPYKELKIEDTTKLTQLNQLLFEVERHQSLGNDFRQVLKQMDNYIKGETLVEIYGADAQFSEYTQSMVWAIITETQNGLKDNPEDVIKKLERIMLQQELEPNTSNVINYYVYVGRLYVQLNQNDSYILNKPEAYVEAYTKKWYKIDKLYRQAITSFKTIDETEVPAKVELAVIHQNLNTAYEKYTETLNREWLSCLKQYNFDYQNFKFEKQYDFFKNEIKNQDQKVVVIISDALRYEVGENLLSELHADTKNTAQMRYMLASIPSKTNIGMAQLLPYNSAEFNQGDVKLDGILNSGIDNRTKILEGSNKVARAIQYADIEGMSQSQIRAIFKDDIVYVYHDVIDSTGDKKPSERRTFEVVEDAINELKKFIKKLHSSYNVAKVFVTSDHGFLYNDREIQEKEKEKLPKVEFVQSHNRYFLTTDSVEPELGYCLPLSATTMFKEPLFVTIPASTNRYKKQGVGHQFVHGGGSLQELVIPLIESSRKREKVTQKVNPILVYKGTLKVVSNILRLNVLQENEISRFEKERKIRLGLYKDSELVSNEEHLVLNSTSQSPSERMSRVELTLSNEASSETLLKLKVFDIEDALNPLIEERVQNNTIIPTDF